MDGRVRLESRVRGQLQALDAQRLRRLLRPPCGIDLSSNDYLRLATDPRITERMIEAIHRDGCGSTGSRLLRGHREAFERVERAFAAFKRAERSLYFSSGYLANLAVLTTFVERGDVVIQDRLNHASLRDGVRLTQARAVTLPHAGADALERLLAKTDGSGQTFVLTESLFSMDGDIPPLGRYAAACRAAGALLVVDEAHAVGIYGAKGSGLIEETGIGDEVFLSIDTAGKALGVAGAFVSGPAWAIEYLEQRARPFVFSTAPPPALAAAIEASLAIVADEPDRRARVRHLAAFLRDGLAGADVPVAVEGSQIVPIVIGEVEPALAVAAALQAQGFDVRAIRPPSVPLGTARLRVSVNAGLDEEALARFSDALLQVLPPIVRDAGQRVRPDAHDEGRS